MLSVLVCSATAIAFMLSLVLTQESYSIESLYVTLAATPPAVFCGALPFLLVRAITGYRIAQQTRATLTGNSITMEDFFLTTGVIGAMLVPLPAAAQLSPYVELKVAADLLGAFLLTSLIAMLPTTLAYLIIQRRWLRVTVLIALCLAVPLAYSCGFVLVSGFSITTPFVLEQIAPVFVTAAGCFCICLIILRATQFRWLRNTQLVAKTELDLNDQPQPVVGDPTVLLNRVAALVLVLISAIQSVAYRAIAHERARVTARLEEINRQWSPRGGYVKLGRYSATGLTAPARAQADDIQFALRGPELLHAKLEGSPVTDEILTMAGKLGGLQTLNLNRTQISDAGLLALRVPSRLPALHLGYTRVTAKGLKTFLTEHRGYTLDLSGLGLNDKDLASLPLATYQEIYLRSNPLTSAILPKLLHAKALDLSNTQIDGSGLMQLKDVYRLSLDQVAIDDAQLQAFMKQHPKVVDLSLRDTQVTDASLHCLGGIESLNLSGAGVTMDGLLEHEINAMHLGLNGKHFDGTLFAPRPEESPLANRIWAIEQLDMRASGLCDRDVHHLANIKGLMLLDVSDCELTDAALPSLALLGLTYIDITGTKISGPAALKALSPCNIYLAEAQCTAEILENQENWNLWIDQRLAERPLGP